MICTGIATFAGGMRSITHARWTVVTLTTARSAATSRPTHNPGTEPSPPARTSGNVSSSWSCCPHEPLMVVRGRVDQVGPGSPSSTTSPGAGLDRRLGFRDGPQPSPPRSPPAPATLTPPSPFIPPAADSGPPSACALRPHTSDRRTSQNGPRETCAPSPPSIDASAS